MVLDNLDDLDRQSGFPSLVSSYLDVALDDGDREARVDVIVLVHAVLVLDEVLGMLDLSDIVIETSYPCKKGVGTDCLGTDFRKVSNRNAVAIGSGS